ncbi:MAG: hypothetical protein NC548_40035 [Lachnospiraceae bacterium]|nr:hypothetical protein [Lachnospiraceae bacterium]MCM1232961.1 hypothetical protein [Ruminococcus flavefaciens]
MERGRKMKLYPDCDYFNDERDSEFAPKDRDCKQCYRWEICIAAFMKDKKPIPIEELLKYVGKKLWVQSPDIPKYGREIIVENVDISERILWCVSDFTCHDYGRVWVAYDIIGEIS